jgi:hypothetical protein
VQAGRWRRFCLLIFAYMGEAAEQAGALEVGAYAATDGLAPQRGTEIAGIGRTGRPVSSQADGGTVPRSQWVSILSMNSSPATSEESGENRSGVFSKP